MKKVLGLDLGVGSVGWCALTIDDQNNHLELLGIGARVIPLSNDETTGFTKGNGESIGQQRTARRSARRGIDRFQQRRKRIASVLDSLNMTFPAELLRLDPMSLWEMRAQAAAGVKMSLPQIGRIIMHINSRRGYRHSKEDAGDKKQSDYLSKISERARVAAEANQTPGQYFACRLKDSVQTTPNGKFYTYRIKENVFPRKSYEDELHLILSEQQKHYPEILTDDNIIEIEQAVFYQRPLKSCKHLVSLCEFESMEVTAADGSKKLVGPRVAHVSSPIFQVERMWEAINHIVLTNPRNRKRKNDNELQMSLFGEDRKMAYEFRLTHEERKEVFDFLNEHEQMKGSDLLKILKLKKDDNFSIPANIAKGLKGNQTRVQLMRALDGMPGSSELLRFELHTEESGEIDEETGEEIKMKRISSDYLREPLYQLWHTIYSITDKDELREALKNKFNITDDRVLERLYALDFRGAGYGNKSAKFICKILPYLQNEGLTYSEACERVGKNHSASLTKKENGSRELLHSIPLLKKGELRQPVVEKILNQMINLVNAAIDKYGPFDEVRIELARELKRSKAERSADYERNSRREQDNDRIRRIIVNEYGMRPSANKIQKYRMWEESGHCCMYCGAELEFPQFCFGLDNEKEHVIPRSLLFDDSFSNKVCACRECNDRKGQMTGYDFAYSQGDKFLQNYKNRVDDLHARFKSSKGKDGISKTKCARLLASRNDIPQDFIKRDLRLTQYISRKALEILKTVCRDVESTSGSVTDFFRHAWGYDEILHSLNLQRFSDAGQTEHVKNHNGQIVERIVGWNKRLDHRHHAIDALTIALTRQGYIQRLNTLNTLRDASAGTDGGGQYVSGYTDLKHWASSQPHFPTQEIRNAVAGIAVSFKAGNRVTSPGKRFRWPKAGRCRPKTVQCLIVPRGQLTEDHMYGVNRTKLLNQPLKDLFGNPSMICDSNIREAVEKRLSDFAYDVKKAVASCKKNPLEIEGHSGAITKADMWNDEFVMRYPIKKITLAKVNSIVDGAIRKAVEERFAEVGNEDKAFEKSLAERPLFRHGAVPVQIRSVRCKTGQKPKSMTIVRTNGRGAISYAEFGKNHHIALYETPYGNIEESVVPFAVAVERRRLGLPVVVDDTDSLWLTINDRKDELPEAFLARFPMAGRRFIMSIPINDMFIIGLTDDEIKSAVSYGRTDILADHLYRVQGISSNDYELTRHTCAKSDRKDRPKQLKNGDYKRIKSAKTWLGLNPVKVRVDRLGHIILPDHYLT